MMQRGSKLRWLLWLRPGVEGESAEAPAEEQPPQDVAPADDAPPAEEPVEAAEAEEPDLVRQLLSRHPLREPEPEPRQPEPPRVEPQAAPRDPDVAAEEAQLERARQSGMSENDLAWMRWQIAQNRETREAKRMSERALAESRDAADRADFGRLEFTDPELYRAYAPRIEKTIADLKVRGQNPAPRGAILRLLLGDDLLNRKQTKRSTKSEARPAASAPKVERNLPPRARSDVQGRASVSERDARRRRLEGKSI